MIYRKELGFAAATIVTICGQWMGANPVQAQAQQPDAGSVLKELQRTEPGVKPGANKPDIRFPQERVTPADSSVKIKVSDFRINGATLIPGDELRQEIASGIGAELTLTDLRRLAQRLSDLYRRKGLFARALIAEQPAAGGIVEITVIEGKLSAIDIDRLPGTRLSEARARQTITSQQAIGQPLRPDDVQAGMRNLNELPGIAATGVLQPGETSGDVKLGVRVESTPLLTASAYIDNFGLKATGQVRGVAAAQLNSPFSYGDQLYALGVLTERSNYLKAGYSLPVGYSGLRASLFTAHLDYRLNGLFTGFSGDATTYGAALSMPLRRTASSNFFGSVTAEHKHFVNDGAGSINLSDKTLKTLSLEFRGDFNDNLLGPARNAFSIALVAGEVDLGRNPGNLVADQAGPRTQGSFTKLPWNYQRVQTLAPNWELSATVNGQFAGGNLDGYEKMSLGGPSAVRAYPSGEALGDQGWLASAELRHSFNAELQASAFLDAGHITQLHSTFPGFNAGNPNRPNSYTLYGAGIGLQYGRAGDWFIKGMIATRLGNNPGRDINGKDSDGGNSHVRGWLQLAKFF